MTQPTPRPRTGAPASRDIVIGATVYGHDNARFGSVAGSYRNYLIVERGFFMPVDYYVPMAAIERADRDLVVLAVSRDAALTQGWERPPFTSETGQRGLRRPTVGRPTPSPAAPGGSAAARTRQPGAPTGTNPTGWPAPVGDAAATASPTSPASTTGADAAVTPSTPSGDAATVDDAGGRQPDNVVPAAAPKETTAISPVAAFGDTYAVGTNTDSYQAMTDFAPADSVPGATASPVQSSPEPAGAESAEPLEDQPDSGEPGPSFDAPDAPAPSSAAPAERPTS